MSEEEKDNLNPYWFISIHRDYKKFLCGNSATLLEKNKVREINVYVC